MGWGIVYPPYSVINMGAIQPPTPTKRWVYSFNGVDSFVFIGQTSFPPDFWFELSFVTSQPGNITVLGDDNSTEYLLQLRDDQVRFYHAQGAVNAIYSLGGLNIKDGFPHRIRVEVLTSIATLFIDGQQIDSPRNITPYTGVNNLKLGASTTPLSYFNGRIYDYKDSLGNNFPINDRTFGAGAPIANSATVLGGERVINGDFDVDADWVKGVGWSIQNGRAELASDGTPQALIQDGVFTIGDTYIVEFDVFSDSSPIGFQDGSFLMVASGTSGRVKAVFVANTERLSFKRAFGSPVGWVDNVSVRKADGYATGINLLESGWTEIPL